MTFSPLNCASLVFSISEDGTSPHPGGRPKPWHRLDPSLLPHHSPRCRQMQPVGSTGTSPGSASKVCPESSHLWPSPALLVPWGEGSGPCQASLIPSLLPQVAHHLAASALLVDRKSDHDIALLSTPHPLSVLFRAKAEACSWPFGCSSSSPGSFPPQGLCTALPLPSPLFPGIAWLAASLSSGLCSNVTSESSSPASPPKIGPLPPQPCPSSQPAPFLYLSHHCPTA